jgi:hypothetical protein
MIPAASEEIFFEVMLDAIHGLSASVGVIPSHDIGPDIPDFDRVIHGIRAKLLAVRADSYPRDSVQMPYHCKLNLIFPQIYCFDRIVKAAEVDVV